ncbi:hypothetical protein K431DRAFT_67925 [Polychaeton citri CBS 116435]|uniref:Cyclin N-terminal domain-containing protein n=1 Tax=Polychaeton citri CBS 116435 TaxID=1314669 RepID=A0A9P4UQD5_9PEZI|nr:hypothetical protein K431DRAFT_67925 [Polychaeton citri CBS 116435]
MNLSEHGLPYGFDAPHQHRGPYEPSIASSASSSQDSVFSGLLSSQSSAASSLSDDFRGYQDEVRDRTCAQVQLAQHQAGYAAATEVAWAKLQEQKQTSSQAQVTSAPVDSKHPRRCFTSRRPPPLQRQCERKTHFVDNLVDSATQMVEVIWPQSASCHNENSGGRRILTLRTYIEETLRRSRTSYSTLQVALYYLVLIKPHVPRPSLLKETEQECSTVRALMCGRRMFLTSLILASKYLQDRNYSAKAWSKMSGLSTTEINSNERTFLSKVSWKLHIPESIFKRWTDVVLKYTPHIPPSAGSGPGQSFSLDESMGASGWKRIIPMLTPELDKVPMPSALEEMCPPQNAQPLEAMLTPTSNLPGSSYFLTALQSSSKESTPTPASVIPCFLEPTPQMSGPPTPALLRQGPLPTPTLTPSSFVLNTPAASVTSSRRPSMCSAMAMAQQGGLNSPESLMSDRTRSSRSSSISSVSTVSTSCSAVAPQRACLARQATCRSAGLPLPPTLKEEDCEATLSKPITLEYDGEMVSSPDFENFAISEKALRAPHKHSKNDTSQQPAPTASTDKGRKRARPRGGRRSNLQEECRILLEEELDAMDEAEEDEIIVSSSPAADYASQMIQRSNSVVEIKAAQPPATLSRRESLRLPVQRREGNKRTCCSMAAPLVSQQPVWAQV